MQPNEPFGPTSITMSQPQDGDTTAVEYETISATQLVQDLKDFFRNNQQRVRAAYHSGTGWEVWLHIELYLYLTEKHPKAQVRRELSYGESTGQRRGKARADLVINKNLRIEIKVQIQGEDAYDLFSKVLNDYYKMQNLVSIDHVACQIIVHFSSRKFMDTLKGGGLDYGQIYSSGNDRDDLQVVGVGLGLGVASLPEGRPKRNVKQRTWYGDDS